MGISEDSESILPLKRLNHIFREKAAGCGRYAHETSLPASQDGSDAISAAAAEPRSRTWAGPCWDPRGPDDCQPPSFLTWTCFSIIQVLGEQYSGAVRFPFRENAYYFHYYFSFPRRNTFRCLILSFLLQCALCLHFIVHLIWWRVSN